jgi:hypothetical protein
MLIPFGILAASGGARISIAGYVAGGTTTVLVTTVDKFAYPSDTRSTLGTGLDQPKSNTAPFANSGVAGYSAGGQASGDTTASVEKFTFPADTRAYLGTGLSGLRGNPTGFANSGTAGYSAGGNRFGSITTVDKFTFPADSRTTLGTGLPRRAEGGAGFSNINVAGYVAGGYDGQDGNSKNNVIKFAFPSDSSSELGTGLSNFADNPAGFSNQAVAGYAAGGYTTNRSNVRITAIDKFAFPGDTRTTLGTGLATATYLASGFSDSGIAGYVAGGNISSGNVATTQKFAFPSDTRSTLGTGLSSSRRGAGGFANEGVFSNV